MSYGADVPASTNNTGEPVTPCGVTMPAPGFTSFSGVDSADFQGNAPGGGAPSPYSVKPWALGDDTFPVD